MRLFNRLIDKEENLALVGLGYVGMPIAVAFAQKGIHVIGFDLNDEKIALYKSGIDPTKEVGDETISQTSVEFTSNEKDLRRAKFIIMAVPTPVNTDHTPDLKPVIGASEIVGRNLVPGSIIVYESTVYPGCTEDVCIPILERESGLKCGVDFKVGYSPERINPGDKVHCLENIQKTLCIFSDSPVQQVTEAFMTAFYDKEKRLFADTEEKNHYALHSNALPVTFGIAPQEAHENIKQMIMEKGLCCGTHFSYFVLKALAAMKAHEEELNLIINESDHSWVNMLREGATTCFEAWGKEQKWNTSLCHPWSCAPIIAIIEDIAKMKPHKNDDTVTLELNY